MWMLSVGSTKCILRLVKFLLPRTHKFIVRRVGVARFTREGLIRLRELRGWSCPTARRTSGRMIGSSTGFMLRLAFPSVESSGGVSYPLAAKIEEFKHITKVDFGRTVAGYEECYSAFASAARVVSGRDLIE